LRQRKDGFVIRTHHHGQQWSRPMASVRSRQIRTNGGDGYDGRSAERSELAGLADLAAITCLRQIRGVGRWTAEYVLLRGFGRLQIFPGDDVGARNNLQRWLGLSEALNYDAAK